MQTLTDNKTQNELSEIAVKTATSNAEFQNPIFTEKQKATLSELTCQLIDIRYTCAALKLNYLGHLIDMATTEAESIAGSFPPTSSDYIK